MTKKSYIQQCPACANYVEGKEMRGFVRQMVHDGPETIVEWIPVGGKLIWKGTKEVVRLLMKTNMEQWGVELEKLLYKDIQVVYCCPKCGKEWTENHELSRSEYRQLIADVTESAKNLVYKKNTSEKGIVNDESISKSIETIDGSLRLQIPYSAVENLIKGRHKLDLKLQYVNEDTMAVSVVVKKYMLKKNVMASASVIQVTGNNITLGYQVGIGIDWIIKIALSWFKNTSSGQVDILSNNKIKVHLSKIPQLKNVLKQIALQGIKFEEGYINILFRLR